MNKTSAKIILDSIIDGVRITTFELVFPRIILPEFNTHRVFSRNTSSSRAIPFIKMVRENTGFIPEVWRENGKGMSPKKNTSKFKSKILTTLWKTYRLISITMAWILYKFNVHKEITNRLLEPFMYTKMVVTSSEWSNFFNQRCHSDAQLEIRTLAHCMLKEIKNSTPVETGFHLPYSDEDNIESGIIKSVASCARVSYTNHGKDSKFENDLNIFNKLCGSYPKHLSPFEHQVLSENTFKLLKKRNKWKNIDKTNVHNNLGKVFQFRKIVEKNDVVFKDFSS